MADGQRRLELPHLREALEGRGDVFDRRAEGGIVGGLRVGLDQDPLDLLVGLLREGLLDDRVGPSGLPDDEIALLEVLGSDRPADDDGGDHEREPTEDRGLPVTCAPATHPGREVVALLQR